MACWRVQPKAPKMKQDTAAASFSRVDKFTHSGGAKAQHDAGADGEDGARRRRSI